MGAMLSVRCVIVRFILKQTFIANENSSLDWLSNRTRDLLKISYGGGNIFMVKSSKIINSWTSLNLIEAFGDCKLSIGHQNRI